MIYPMVPFPVTLSDPWPRFQGHDVIFKPTDALSVLCAQLRRDLLAIPKFLFTSDNRGGKCDCPRCLSVCLLARLLKNACMDFDDILRVDKCRDIGTGLLSLIAYELQRWILLRRENPTYRYWPRVLGACRSSDEWFWGVETPLSEVNALYRVPL